MTAAVVAVHYQNDVLGFLPDDRTRAALVRDAARLLRGARGRRVPVVSARIAFHRGYAGHLRSSPMLARPAELGVLLDGTPGAEFDRRLRPLRDEPVVTHRRINAFYGSELEPLLAALGTRRLVVAGVSTHSAVEHTARHAADLGYDVLVASDACAATERELHEASLRNLALHVARVATVDEILAELDA